MPSEPTSALPALSLVTGVVGVWLALAALSLLGLRWPRLITRAVCPLGAIAGLALAMAAGAALSGGPATLVLPLGLPDLPFHLRLDPLSAVFLLLLGGTTTGVSLFASGYLRNMDRVTLSLLSLQYHVFLASMALVLLADDAYLFMVAWEAMAMASYFLVTTNHRLEEVRRAGFIYLLVAHVGALSILLCFGVLSGGFGEYGFDHMRQLGRDEFWSSVVFILALLGFGAKAGLVPVHVWLPEAHPAAPSPVSALMSGVMLKTAVYGLLRVSFDLLEYPVWWWGTLALAVGLVTALFGVMFAAIQSDMKRLLAYSSIENIGLALVGLGLGILFHAYGMGLLAALALTATLYHCVNHALFKSLLFLGTGSVLHATGERNLGRLGGIIHRMPWVALLSLVGVLAIAGLPPLNGFAAEWLLLQAFLLTPGLPHAWLNMLIPVAAGGIALSGALAGYVMVKFYGVVFLGQPREAKLADAHDAGPWERAGLLWLAAGCVALGLAPPLVVGALGGATRLMVDESLSAGSGAGSWLFLAPLAPERASYGPLLFAAVIVVVVLATYAVVRLVWHGRMRRARPWDCGFPALDARMQDTADGFGQPIRRIFEPFFLLRREFPSPFDRQPRFVLRHDDRFWHALYLPLARAVERVSQLAGRLQQGRVHVYLIYSFLTLLALLLFAP